MAIREKWPIDLVPPTYPGRHSPSVSGELLLWQEEVTFQAAEKRHNCEYFGKLKFSFYWKYFLAWILSYTDQSNDVGINIKRVFWVFQTSPRGTKLSKCPCESAMFVGAPWPSHPDDRERWPMLSRERWPTVKNANFSLIKCPRSYTDAK
jgi:hypothetical protein